jgi:Cu2+-containing amine oxidase
MRTRAYLPALLAMLVVTNLGATRAASQPTFPPPRLCSDPYYVLQQFPTTGGVETRWAICWQPMPKFGLAITAAHFQRAPNQPWIRVFWDARVSEMFVPYHSGSPRFMDIGDYSFGLTRLTSTHCPSAQGGVLKPVPGGTLGDGGGDGPGVCVQVHDRGLAWMDDQKARRGEEVVIWGALDAGNYNYILEWTFRDDGVVQGRVGATGRNLPGQEHDAHMHSPTWRLDIDLDGWTGDSAFRGVHSEPLPGPTASDSEVLIPQEGGFAWDPAEFTTLVVHDHLLRNGRGSPTAYELLPLRYGTARHDEDFTRHDFFVTLYDPTEMLGREVLKYADPPESVVDADVVAWYTASVHHEFRDEDGVEVDGRWQGEAHVMWVGFLLKPHNLFDGTPLFPERQ